MDDLAQLFVTFRRLRQGCCHRLRKVHHLFIFSRNRFSIYAHGHGRLARRVVDVVAGLERIAGFVAAIRLGVSAPPRGERQGSIRVEPWSCADPYVNRNESGNGTPASQRPQDALGGADWTQMPPPRQAPLREAAAIWRGHGHLGRQCSEILLDLHRLGRRPSLLPIAIAGI